MIIWRLRKRVDQALILISTIQKFPALVIQINAANYFNHQRRPSIRPVITYCHASWDVISYCVAAAPGPLAAAIGPEIVLT